MGLPAPDLVLYLDVDLDVARRQMTARQQKTHTQADIHEKDLAYLAACLEAGRAAADHYGWRRIECVRDGEMRSVEDIHGEIRDAVAGLLGTK